MRSSCHFASLALTTLLSVTPLQAAKPVAVSLGFPARSAAAAAFSLPQASEEKEAPLSQEQTLHMLQAGVPSRQIEAIARKDGVDFRVTPALERDLRKAGASDGLILLLKK